ncbi:heterokaryon incompatibility protein-domain-containing protein [Trametes polyzona]|nr:heterokaryon incompatibility protein-domain-containing protein [Trametes polyzona]
MWLLTTDTAELICYNSGPPPVYAILSHVWRGQEQPFGEVRAINRQCAAEKPPRNSRDLVHDKIRKCCMWAEAHGFKLVWIDSCCIGKSSSAELSEAINSMFIWYARATVCYAYLFDVDDDERPSRVGSTFRRSKWFTRGWTLQELIAPHDVIFLSKNWQPLASKLDIAWLLEDITGIEAAVLEGERSLGQVDFARRMSWAANRETTRIEDQAYCLMGIFDVNLPTIYGEGTEAFVRLQEEIIKRSPDRTLLAWGPRHTLKEVVVGYRSSIFPTDLGEAYIRESCLLARSPAAFANAAKLTSVAVETLAAAFHIPIQRSPLVVSSHGAHTSFPIIQFVNHCCLALLPCQEDGAFVALVLRFQGTNGPWAIGTRALTAETVHVRQHDKSSRPQHEGFTTKVATMAHETPVRCVLIRDLYEIAACMQHPLRKWETVPSPLWASIFVAYRPQNVLVRSVRIKEMRLRRSYMVPCKLVIPAWTLKELERKGYTLTTPFPSLFVDLTPGQQYSLVFATPVVNGRWDAFAVHIGAGERPRSPTHAHVEIDTENHSKSMALWCDVHFPPRAEWTLRMAKQWISNHEPGLTSDPDLEAFVESNWRHWGPLHPWFDGCRTFGRESGPPIRIRFIQLCDLPHAHRMSTSEHGIRNIHMVYISLVHRDSGMPDLRDAREPLVIDWV